MKAAGRVCFIKLSQAERESDTFLESCGALFYTLYGRMKLAKKESFLAQPYCSMELMALHQSKCGNIA